MATGRTKLAKGFLGQLAGILSIPVTAKDDNQFFPMNAGNDGPVKFIHMVEKIGNNHQNIRGAHPAEVNIGPALARLDFVKGNFKVAQFRAAKLC